MNKIKFLIIGLLALLLSNELSAQTNSVHINAPNTSIYTSFQWNIVVKQYVYDDGISETPSVFQCAGNGTAYFTRQQPKPGTLYIHVEDYVEGWHLLEGEQIIYFNDDSQINVEFHWIKDIDPPVGEVPHE